MSTKTNLHKAKNNGFYISSIRILLSFRPDKGVNNCDRETSELYERGAF